MDARTVPWWGIVSSAVPPVLLAAGWTIAASHRGPAVPWALRPEVAAGVSVLLLVLLAWFGLELVTSAGQAGLAERVLGEAQSGWPFVVVVACRHLVPMMARYRLLHGYR